MEPAPKYTGTKPNKYIALSKTKYYVISGILQTLNNFILFTKKKRRIMKVTISKRIGCSLQKKAACKIVVIMVT